MNLPTLIEQELKKEFLEMIEEYIHSDNQKVFKDQFARDLVYVFRTFAYRIIESVDEDVIGEMENPVGRDEYARNKLRDEMRTKLQMIKADTLIGDR